MQATRWFLGSYNNKLNTYKQTKQSYIKFFVRIDPGARKNMSKIIFLKKLLVISITAILISPYVIAEESTNKMIPGVNKNYEIKADTALLKSNDNSLKTLEWLREIGKKQVGEASYKMAIYSMQRQDWGKAKKLIYEAVTMEPNNPNYLKLAIHITYNQRDYKMAEVYLLRILSIKKETFKDNPLEHANLLDNLAIIYKAQNRFNDAKMILQQSLSINEANTGDQYPKLIERLYRMTDINIHLGNYGDAVLEMEQTIQVLENNINEYSAQEIAKAYHNIGDIYRFQKHFNNSEIAYLKALKLWEENTQQDNPGKNLTIKSLSLVQTAQKHLKKQKSNGINF